jgi:hypothetical protein
VKPGPWAASGSTAQCQTGLEMHGTGNCPTQMLQFAGEEILAREESLPKATKLNHGIA